MYSIAKVASVCYNDNRRTSSVTSMLQELGWEDLKSRREQNKVTMMYQTIVNNLVKIRPIPDSRLVYQLEVINNGSWYHIAYCSTTTRDPFSHLQSVSGIFCLPVPYQHQLWMTSSSVLVSQDRSCEQHAFN